MIERIQAYKASDGTVFADLSNLKAHELMSILPTASNDGSAIVASIVKNEEQVINILTTGPKSLPKARAINGGTKRKKPTVAATPVSEPTTSASN